MQALQALQSLNAHARSADFGGAMVRRAMTSVLCVVGAMLALATSAHAAPGVIATTPEQREAATTQALAKVGSPYHPGAAGPKRFDCSGLVTYAFRLAGAPLAARSSYDLWNHGARVKRSALRRGDLVWTWDRGFGHVGIYIGGGQYVHAPGTGRRVTVAPLPFGRDYVGAVRP
jgi:cell wall-associated NlpC family hydrolase